MDDAEKNHLMACYHCSCHDGHLLPWWHLLWGNNIDSRWGLYQIIIIFLGMEFLCGLDLFSPSSTQFNLYGWLCVYLTSRCELCLKFVRFINTSLLYEYVFVAYCLLIICFICFTSSFFCNSLTCMCYVCINKGAFSTLCHYRIKVGFIYPICWICRQFK